MTALPLNRKLIAEEFAIFKPALIAHSDTAMDLKSLKLFHEILGFNHRAEPERHDYYIPYEAVCKTQDKRNIQKLISQEVERIATSMQGFVFKVDKKKMQEITGERNTGSISPFDRIVYQGSNIKCVLGTTFKQLLIRYQQFYLGDARTVRQLNHKSSIHMYWLIISHSWRESSFEITLKDLKIHLGCEGQYEGRWDNFKRFILDPICQEFSDTWAAFAYETIRKGRKIHALRFDFKSDAQVIRSIINESPYPFEHQLHLYRMDARKIVHIREQVNKGRYTEQDVNAIIKHVQHNRKIKNKAGYIVQSLKEGWYRNLAVQIELPMAAAESPSPGPAPSSGRWGEVQQYWKFTSEQMQQLKSKYNEHTLYKKHYGLQQYFDALEPSRDEVFQSFIA